MSRRVNSAPTNTARPTFWSTPMPYRHMRAPSLSSKSWLKPATVVGSMVWLAMRGRSSTRKAAARTVVPNGDVHVTPTFGLIWSSSMTPPFSTSPLSPTVAISDGTTSTLA